MKKAQIEDIILLGILFASVLYMVFLDDLLTDGFYSRMAKLMFGMSVIMLVFRDRRRKQ
ncbi:hypothetical protein [Echinicola vietnamensis]|uniref:Uncharacterized protein n=1 Tax=Echinicola vietnamensis (strain DSM 17526 / LMG 23754 / KMM 6221) TaxID=926556 RepID=L0FXA2_ECHVK|nr:hypothetical protein [Echinicola vietnamensis]AGA78499.1 hypothetical protein Echvi_2251 [Echinicola vietnamensis DSM 17526]